MALGQAGAHVTFLECTKSMPLMLDYLVSLLRNARVLGMKCDVVIAQKALANAALPLLVKRAFGTPVVVDIDDIDWGFRSGPLSWINRALIRPVPRRCDCVTYHSDRLRPVLAGALGVDDARLFQLPQGVDLDVFHPAAGVVERPRLPPDFDGTALVVHPAHLNVACELESIFQIIVRAIRMAPQIRLLVVGGGPRLAYHRKRAEAVGVAGVSWFTGLVSPQTVASYLHAARAGIVYLRDTPANVHRQSMKLREMLAAGVPVACNDANELGSFSDFTYQGTSEYDDVAHVLTRLVDGGGDGREAAGAAYVRANMDWREIGRRFHDRLCAMV
jgi:glycosyltransferase involved in cell wall biosynthesis